MSKKKLFFVLSAVFFIFGLAGCNFNQKLNLGKTGKITVVLNSGARSVDIGQLIQEENAFLKVNLRGDVEDSQTVTFKKGASISFEDIPIGSTVYLQAYIFTEIKLDDEAETIKTETLYTGKSESVVIAAGDNSIPLVLKAIGDPDPIDNPGNDDPGNDNPNNGQGNNNGNNSGNQGGNTGNGSNDHPATGKIEIFMNAEEEIFCRGSEIVFTAQDGEGNPIAADDINVEFHMLYSPYLYAPLEDELIPAKATDPDGGYEIIKNENDYKVKTFIPDDVLDISPEFYFLVYANDGNIEKRKKFTLPQELMPGDKNGTRFFITYGGDKVYASGSTIVFNATINGEPLPADKLKIELFYEDTDQNTTNLTSDCSVERIKNDVIFTTAIPGGTMANIGGRYFYFVVTNIETSESKRIDFEMELSNNHGITFVMTPKDGIISTGDSITITAFDKILNPIDSTEIQIGELYYMVKNNVNTIEPSKYSISTESGYITITPGTGFDENQLITLPVSIDKGELGVVTQTFKFTLATSSSQNIDDSNVNATIDVTGKSATEITESIINKITPVVNNNSVGSINLVFTGICNDSGMNIYSTVVSALFDEHYGINRAAELVSINLDFSECDGSSLEIIPAGTFENITILDNIELSCYTKEIGDNAFSGVTLSSFDSYNVTKIGKDSFRGTEISGTINLRKVTEFGNEAGFYLKAGTLILGSAEEIYKTDENHGHWVFNNIEVTKIVAPKLKRIQEQTFAAAIISGGTNNGFAIDSLRLVGYNSLCRNYNTNKMHNIYFENDENAKNWYKGIGSFDVNGDDVEEDVEDIFVGIYNGTYDIDEIINNPNNTYGDNYHYIEAVDSDDPDDIIYELSLTNNSYSYIRVIP